MEKEIEYKMVELGLPSGLKWADRNVGAVNIQDYGKYFAWSAIEECEVKGKRDLCAEDFKGDGEQKVFVKLPKREEDTVRCSMGGGWRTPTKQEAWELVENTEHEIGTVEDVKGMFFVNKNDSSKRIFVPFCGNCRDSYVITSDEVGYLWTSTSVSEYTAIGIAADNGGSAGIGFGQYGDCFCVRGVHE